MTEESNQDLVELFQRAAARHQPPEGWQRRVTTAIADGATSQRRSWTDNRKLLFGIIGASTAAIAVLVVLLIRSSDPAMLAYQESRPHLESAKKIRRSCDPNDPLCGMDGSSDREAKSSEHDSNRLALRWKEQRKQEHQRAELERLRERERLRGENHRDTRARESAKAIRARRCDPNDPLCEPPRTDFHSELRAKAVARMQPLVKKCAEEHAFRGLLSVVLRIDSDGSVKKIGIYGGTRQLKQCLSDALKSSGPFQTHKEDYSVQYTFGF